MCRVACWKMGLFVPWGNVCIFFIILVDSSSFIFWCGLLSVGWCFGMVFGKQGLFVKIPTDRVFLLKDKTNWFWGVVMVVFIRAGSSCSLIVFLVLVFIVLSSFPCLREFDCCERYVCSYLLILLHSFSLLYYILDECVFLLWIEFIICFHLFWHLDSYICVANWFRNSWFYWVMLSDNFVCKFEMVWIYCLLLLKFDEFFNCIYIDAQFVMIAMGSTQVALWSEKCT